MIGVLFGRDAVFYHYHLKATVEGPESGQEHTDVGMDATDQEMTYCEPAKLLFKFGLVETVIGGLMHNNLTLHWAEFVNDLGTP